MLLSSNGAITLKIHFFKSVQISLHHSFSALQLRPYYNNQRQQINKRLVARAIRI